VPASQTSKLNLTEAKTKASPEPMATAAMTNVPGDVRLVVAVVAVVVAVRPP